MLCLYVCECVCTFVHLSVHLPDVCVRVLVELENCVVEVANVCIFKWSQVFIVLVK